MNKWGPLLFAVFCIFQPIFSENLFDGRERCLQRPDFNRKDFRLLKDQSNARPEIRVDDRNGREFAERLNQHGLRYSERNNNRDDNIRSEDRRSRSNDRTRVSPARQRIEDNSNEGRLDRRSSRNERLEPEFRNVREERRISIERAVRNIRLIRSLSQDDRRNERQDTRARKILSRDSQFVFAPNRRIVEHFDDVRRIRQDRELNERRESHRKSRDSQVREDARAEAIFYDRFVRNDDSSRRNDERLQREFRSNVPDNRRQNERFESVIRARDNNEISGRKVPATSRRVFDKRGSEERREADGSLRMEMRKSSDKAIVRLDDSRRQANERMMRNQRNVPASRRSNMRLESVRIDDEEIDRRSSPRTAQRIDENRQIRRELRANSDRAYEREFVQRKVFDESRDLRRESRDRASNANERYMRSDDLVRRTSERLYDLGLKNIRSEFIRTYNAEINRRNSLITRVNTKRRNKVGNRYFQRETRNSDIADSRFDSQASRIVRRDARQNSRIDVSRNYDEISQRSSPVSIMNVGDRVEYLQGRYTSRDSLRQTRERRTDDGFINGASSNDRRDSLERSDDTQDSRRDNRRISEIRFEALASRIERVQSKYRRERHFVSPSNMDVNRFAATARAIAAVEIRESMQRNEPRNIRREIRAVRLDDSNRREDKRFNNRVQSVVLQRRTRDSNIRARNVELGRDNRRVDENRITRDALKDRVTLVRDENESRHNNRDHERTNERSLDKTMPIQRQLEMRIQRDDTSRHTRITDANTRKVKSDQSRSRNNREDERNVQRRVSREILGKNRHESRFAKNAFERNMERDSSERLLDIGNRRERDSRTTKNVKDNENIREEIRLSTAPHDESSDETSDLSFTWHHLLYILQAAYIVGLLVKLSQAKENLDKKTRIGLWTHATKLIKVD